MWWEGVLSVLPCVAVMSGANSPSEDRNKISDVELHNRSFDIRYRVVLVRARGDLRVSARISLKLSFLGAPCGGYCNRDW
jgi:hypothetical protein